MTQFSAPPAPGEVEAFIGQVVTDLSAAFSGALVNVGRKLGLYRAMDDLGACTSRALCTRVARQPGCCWLCHCDPREADLRAAAGAGDGPRAGPKPRFHGVRL